MGFGAGASFLLLDIDLTKLGGGFVLAILGFVCLLVGITGKSIGITGIVTFPAPNGAVQRSAVSVVGLLVFLSGLLASGQLPQPLIAWLPQPGPSAFVRDDLAFYDAILKSPPMSPDQVSARLDQLGAEARSDKDRCDLVELYGRYAHGAPAPNVLMTFELTEAGKNCRTAYEQKKTAFASIGLSIANVPPPLVAAQIGGVNGIDISGFNRVDWAAVSSTDLRFVFLKATEGRSFVDATFNPNRSALKAAGIPTGAYHYFTKNTPAAAQAAFFLSSVKVEPGDLPPALDIESLSSAPSAADVESARTWLEIVERATGRKPLVYVAGSHTIIPDERFADYPLWLGAYGSALPAPPAPWNRVTVWQYSQAGIISGSHGKVDLNRFIGSEADFKALLGT